MMTPLYFPHTSIPDDDLEKIASIFGAVSVFSALNGKESSTPRLKQFVPASGDETRLREFLKEYRNFAAMNRGKVSCFLNGKGGFPLYDPDSALGIRSEVMKGLTEQKLDHPDCSSDRDSLLWALAFLEIARDYDETNRTIDRELECIDHREKMLLKDLIGEGDDEISLLSNPMPGLSDDSESGVRLEARMSAWARLFEHAWPDPEKTGDGFYLTASLDVIDYLCEFDPGLTQVSFPGSGPVDGALFSRWLEMLVSCDYPKESLEIRSSEIRNALCSMIDDKGTGPFSIWISPGRPPGDFFSALSGGGKSVKKGRLEIKNTVIGLFKP